MFIKGFDKDLKCRGYQFEIGKEYEIKTNQPLKLCTDTVFHFCRNIQQVHNHYSVDENNRFCEIEVLGQLVEDDDKCGSNHIKIIREITGDELNVLIGKINGNTGLFNTGNENTGNCNTGDLNSGNKNTGDFNTCDFSAGFFCTIEPKARIFDIETDMTVTEFRNSKYYDALYSAPFMLTEWVEYSEEEMQADENKKLIGGHLKKYTYKEACANWWDRMTDENKAIIQQMPNFNAKKFYQITGIKL